MTKEQRQQIVETLIGARASINAALRMVAEQPSQPPADERKKPLTFGEPNPEDDGA